MKLAFLGLNSLSRSSIVAMRRRAAFEPMSMAPKFRLFMVVVVLKAF